ncbi:hypothetical protein GCM10020258_44570 [Sphingomonas yabuuchiae]
MGMTPFSQFYRAAGLFAIATAMTAAAPMPGARWTPAWGSSQMRIDGANADKLAKIGPATIRQIVHLTAGGKTLRLRLSNIAGTTPLKIGAATIGLATPGRSDVSAILPIRFDGATDVIVPPGPNSTPTPSRCRSRRGAMWRSASISPKPSPPRPAIRVHGPRPS